MTRSTPLLGLVTVLALAVAACGGTPEVVPLSGEPADIQALEGEWAGEYHAYAASGRSGTIFFRLEAGADTATGDVLMHVGGRETAGAIPVQGDPWAQASHDQILSITFVRAGGGSVFGKLDPYPDPICGCELSTTFSGRVEGRVIEGTYTSEHVNGGDRTTGRWRVVRRGG